METEDVAVRIADLEAEVERLRRFIDDRVKCATLRRLGGYHGRRVYMEAAKLLSDDTWGTKESVLTPATERG